MYYNDNTIIYFDGQFVKASEAATDLYSQSLHYGYSVFEGIRSYTGKIFKPKEHFDRLLYSAKVLKMPFNYYAYRLEELSYEVLRRNDFKDAYIRPLVFCSPNMGLTKGKRCYLTIQAWDWTYFQTQSLRVITSPYCRPNPAAFHVEAKVGGHYVNSILACQDAKDNGYDEALLLDQNGFIAEAPGANVFMEINGILYTPPRGNILPGITRATVFEICRELNIPVKERFFKPAHMYDADAAFFCGTAAEIMELKSLDNHEFKMNWKNSLSYKIQQAYKRLVLGEFLPQWRDDEMKRDEISFSN